MCGAETKRTEAIKLNQWPPPLPMKVKSESHSVVPDSLPPHGLYSPWNSPGQNTGSLFLLPGDLRNPGIKPRSPSLQKSLPTEPQGKPSYGVEQK